MVRISGNEALSARNGLEAVALFRSYSRSIDLVVTDLKMPVMDGPEAIRLIRKIRPDEPIICVSGYSEEGSPAGTMFLPKPFTYEQFRTRIGEALAAHVS